MSEFCVRLSRDAAPGAHRRLVEDTAEGFPEQLGCPGRHSTAFSTQRSEDLPWKILKGGLISNQLGGTWSFSEATWSIAL